MATLVLIHGSGQNARSWDRVRALLPQHETVTIELPADRPEMTATDFARLIIDEIASAPDDCVVVGHSASGMYLPIIANLRPVGALVYVAAYVPQPGKSMREVFTENPEMFNPAWIAAGERWADPAKWRDLADEFLFHDVPPADREWSYSTMRPMRIDAARLERCEKQSTVRSLAIVANQDRTITPNWQVESALDYLENSLGISIGSGHCPQNSMPDKVAELLDLACHAERWPPRSGSAGPIGYDDFKQFDDQGQLRMFNAITAENRAEIVKTQITRWREMNRNRLTTDQMALLDEILAALVPAIYARPKDRELDRKLRALQDRMHALFTREDIWRSSVRTAPYIPPQV